ncbi:hypothetical protein ABEB36_006951 [Hypothenemus hampei]|uniref:Uncharacterized protein n=1 Tax=Hypothenemus hampei TaxID=57062 RepID=A0ABD1EVB7_HYPHA
MYDHSSAVYNNRCLKAPRNPKNDHPLTQFDQKFLHQLHNEVTRGLNEKMKTNLGDCSEGNVKSFIDFFDSIPEYDDINYLSNREFYKKLARIKEKQKEFCAYWNRELKFETKDTEWIEDYKNLKSGQREMSSAGSKSKKSSIKADCDKKYLDLEENLSLSDKDLMVKPPSRRSVRIETPSTKSTPNLTPEPCSRPKSRLNWEDLILDVSSIANTPLPLETKSVPNSPVKRGKSQETYDGITIPKPFQMTIRDEENRIVEEIFLKTHKPEKEDVKTQQFKAHDVPIESQIPLFDKIMEDQQRRSQKSKEQRKANLQAQMRPFSFTKRDEEIQELTRKFSKSLPCVYNDEPPLKSKKFKANPIPRNLFSNYIYKKMHEDEFYRAIQKKVRAEEMLKQASLPPSMAKREMCKPKVDVCPRSFRELQIDEDIKKVSRRKTRKIPNYKAYHDKYERELEELKNEFISTSPRPFKFNKPSKKRV